MKDVLFICEANVGRSQIAEGYYNHFMNKKRAISAAVKDYREKYNYRPVDYIISSMREDGLDISHQRITLLTQEMLTQAKQIVVFCDKLLCPDFLLHDKRVAFYQIEDPFGKETEQIRQIRNQIKGIVLQIIEKEYVEN